MADTVTPMGADEYGTYFLWNCNGAAFIVTRLHTDDGEPEAWERTRIPHPMDPMFTGSLNRESAPDVATVDD